MDKRTRTIGEILLSHFNINGRKYENSFSVSKTILF